MAAAPAPAPGDFNDARLQSGRVFYDEKRYLEAIDQFRVAAFGFLSRPASLSESLARLTLAQKAAGRGADVDATIQRFLEVQRRFPTYPPPGLDADRQAEFRTILLARVPEATLLSVPALAGLVETEEQKMAKLSPAERRTALEASARRDPTSAVWPVALARDASQRSDWKDAEKWADKALALQPDNADALALRGRARLMRGQAAQARADFAALPSGELDKRPELYADVFVVSVEAGDWQAADDVAARIPANLANRADVARAQQKLAAEHQRRASAAPARPPAPQAAPQAATASSASASRASTSTNTSTSAKPPAPAPTVVPDPAALAARSKEVLAQSRQLIQAGRAGDAQRLLTSALQADPQNRELRLVLLEAACLTRSYRDGASQIAFVAPFGETEAPSMFYAAVVLYETGKADEARGYLRRAIPRVSGPLVDEYSKKILGP